MTGEFGKIRTFKGAPTNPHRGTDYAPKANSIIPAVADGEVALIQWSNVLGWVLVLKARHGKKTYYVGYCHLACATHGVNCKGPGVLGDHSPFRDTVEGQKKKQGEPVGRVGNSGSASSGAHLHITLSESLRGVFSGTVLDIREFIKGTAKKAPAAKRAVQKSAPTPKICPTCNQAIQK
jgi:murein DD-endopeptidase MepM/ murein hydrolase activator NlpD